MYRKSSWGLLYALVLAIAAVMVAAYALGLRGVPEHRLIDAGLVLVALLALAWPSVARRALLLEGSARAGIYSMRVHQPMRVAWRVEELSRISEEAERA